MRYLGGELEPEGRVLGATPDEPVEKVLEARDLVENWLSRLPKLHSEACRLIYLEEKTHHASRAVLGVSGRGFNILHRESLGLLNESFRNKNRTAMRTT